MEIKDGVLIKVDNTDIINGTFTIPEGVTSIGDDAFRGCSDLIEIKIPEGVTSIGDGAFAYCNDLTKIKIPEGVTSIGYEAFCGCSHLTEIKIPEGVTNIDDDAFASCSDLTEIKIPEGVTSIGDGAFAYCSHLTKIRIPEGVTSIGATAFRGCSDLTEIRIPEGVTSIDYGAFEECRSLTEIRIPEGVTSIGDNAFRGCSDLIEIKIPEGVTSIGNDAFRGCSDLIEIKIPEGVTSIGNDAFRGCSDLIEIKISEGVTSIGNDAFAYCNDLTKIKIPEGVTSIGDGAFAFCSHLTEIAIPEGVTSIGKYAFTDCIRLTEITIPEGVTSIGAYAFNYCRSLKGIKLPEGVTSIRSGAFRGCRNLTEIEIPEGVTSISAGAFIGCSLRKIKYGNHTLELPNNIEILSLNKYGLIICTQKGISILLKNQKDLIKEGYIDENLSQKQIDEQEKRLRGKLEAIYNNKSFILSNNFNQEHAINYLNKIIDLVGINEAENLLKIPNIISQSDIQQYGENLLKVYEPKYKLDGNIPLVITMLENIDTVIGNESKDVRNDRNKFYTKFNELLEKENKDLDIKELLETCAKEIGLNLNISQIEKIQHRIQTMQLTEKSSEIRTKIEEKLNSEEQGIMQIGVSSTLIYNVIKQNILNGGKKQDIEEIFNKEINKTNADGTNYYGASILRQQDKLKKVIKELYAENNELLNNNMVNILRNTKQAIGNRWILKLKNSKNNIIDLQSMTEEEQQQLLLNMEKNQINIDLKFSKKYELRPNISLEQALETLNKDKYPELLTYEKAEMMFSGMKEPVSEKFGKWFVEHKQEIMRDAEYPIKLATLHNEFEYLLQDSITNAIFENKGLSPKLAFDILDSRETNGRHGNEELVKIASSVNISREEFKTAEDIFEITKKRERSYIPTVKNIETRYRGRILRADDPMNILAGNATNCCQKVGGEGEGSMMHATTENNGRIFIVEEIDEKGNVVKPVAQSWVWRNKDRVCFDNIEIPEAEKQRLRNNEQQGGDKKAQQEILEIYKKCAENMIKQDERMLGELVRNKKITQEMYEQIVIKDVTVGTGYNDLGNLVSSGLEVVPTEEMILPKEKDKIYNSKRPWIDSGRDSVIGEGAQLYLAKGEKRRDNKSEKQYDLEDLPVKPMYYNEREVRHLKARTIDNGVVEKLKEIEGKVFRNQQKLLSDCKDYKDLANVYDIDKNEIQVQISRENDWYMIFKEDEKELYIADLGMVNGINAQGRGKEKTEVVQQTLEMEESIYKLMLDAAEEQKQVRFEATEDTSYINIMKMAKKGLVNVQNDNAREWGRREGEEIKMHDMIITVNKEKMQEELKRAQERLKKKKDERLLRKVEDKLEDER